jgi:hypothetical protein
MEPSLSLACEISYALLWLGEIPDSRLKIVPIIRKGKGIL